MTAAGIVLIRTAVLYHKPCTIVASCRLEAEAVVRPSSSCGVRKKKIDVTAGGGPGGGAV